MFPCILFILLLLKKSLKKENMYTILWVNNGKIKHTFSSFYKICILYVFFLYSTEENIKDIEFTVTTLKTQQDSNDTNNTPEHYRSSRFSSFKKTGNIGKAVRSKLSKTLYSSIDHSNKVKTVQSIDLDDSMIPQHSNQTQVATSPSEKEEAQKPGLQSQISHEKAKKKSKLCSLL